MRVISWWLLSLACACGSDAWVMAPEGSHLRFDLRPSLETVVWAGDTPAPALLETDDSVFLAPRLRLDADVTAGEHWSLHAAACIDRGFDPGGREDGDIRLDEIMLRWRPCEDNRLNFQIGRFPTAFGAWKAGHGFFDDAFLLAPLPYSQIIGVQTRDLAAMTPAAIHARATGTAPPVSSLDKNSWASMVWGPSYGTGASVFGASGCFDYAAEIKNSALSSHPDSWEDNGFDYPAFTTRVGYRPDAAWALGLSASRGPWLEENAPGVDRGDFLQNALGLDARWAHHDLIVTGELLLSEFETPSAGDLQAASWFLGLRWKTSPGLWLAARFGQMLANDANGPTGADVPWQGDVWRAEVAAGWRLTPDLLLKAGYAFTHTDGDDEAGEHLLGSGIGWRF